MFFNRALGHKMLSWALAAAFLGQGACTRFLNEKPPEPQTLEVSNTRFTCLQNLPSEIRLLLEGTLPAEEIRNGFKCTTDALLYFKNKTIGTDPEAYAPEDLRNFFGKYFLKKNNVTADFARELFKVKRVLVGGSEKMMTKLEIQKLVDLLEVIKEQTVLLAPHATTLLGQPRNPTGKEIDQAVDQLSRSLGAILREVDLVNSGYGFRDFKNFIEGLGKFVSPSEPFFLTDNLDNNMSLVEAIKNIFIGRHPRLDSLPDWSGALSTGVGLYKVWIRYHYFIQGKNLAQPAQVQALLAIAAEGVELLEKSLPLRDQGGVPFEDLDGFLDGLEDRGALPLGLSADALQEAYKKIVLRILDPQRHNDPRGLFALERNHLLALKHELQVFRLHQAFIDALPLEASGRIGFKELHKAAERFQPEKGIDPLWKVDSLEKESLINAWRQGRDLLLKEFPVFYTPSGQVVLSADPEAREQSWGSLLKWNLMRALTRLLLLGYGEKQNFPSEPQVLREEGLEQWYVDFQKVGQEIKAFDPRSLRPGARSFLEANLFTFEGNGDREMSLHETFDFLSLLISGGLNSAERIRKDFTAENPGCVLKEKDIFGYPLFNEPCFQKSFKAHFASFFENLPGMVAEVETLSSADWEKFYQNLMDAARVSPRTGGKVETADLRTAVMILHYTESLMSVYDRDHNGRLNNDEIRAAAPRFYELMKSQSPSDSSWLVTDFFLFLVHKGQKPTAASYAYFQTQKAFGSLDEVGRAKILRVFKVLKDEAAKK